MINPTQLNIPDHTQHSPQTESHYPGGIQVRNPSK